jgi:hypothetical protein
MNKYSEIEGINFTENFRENMYNYMWQYFNLDVIQDIFYGLESKELLNIQKYNGMFNDKFKKSICFKGDDKDGHYFYVDKNLKVYGTFESNLLNNETDDGVCHSIAIIYALKDYLPKYGNLFKITLNPQTKQQFKNNYLNILNFYNWLIESKIWDYVIKYHFPNETVGKSKKALELIKEEIIRF